MNKILLLTTPILFSYMMMSISAFAQQNTFQQASIFNQIPSGLSGNAVATADSEIIVDFNQQYDNVNKIFNVTFKLFKRDVRNDFVVADTLEVSSLSDSVVNDIISKVIIQNDKIIVFAISEYHQLEITENGSLRYIGSTSLPFTYFDQLLVLDADHYIVFAEGVASVVEVNDIGEASQIFDFDYLHESGDTHTFKIAGSSIYQFTVNPVNPTKIHSYNIDLTNNVAQLQFSKEIPFANGTSNVQGESLDTVIISDDRQSVYIRTRAAQFLLKNVATDAIAVVLDEAASLLGQNINYPSVKFYFGLESDGFYKVEPNFDTSQIVKTKINDFLPSGLMHFMSNSLLASIDTYSNSVNVYDIDNGILDVVAAAVKTDENGELPQSLEQIKYFKESGDIIISGRTSNNSEANLNLYIWNYDESTNNLSFIDKAAYLQTSEETLFYRTNIIAQKQNTIFTVVNNNDSVISRLVTFVKSEQGDVSQAQNIELPSSGNGQRVADAFFIDEDTLFVSQFSAEGFIATFCQIDSDNLIIDCFQKKILDFIDVDNQFSAYGLLPTGIENLYIFGVVSNNSSIASENFYLMEVNPTANSFSIIQEFALPSFDNVAGTEIEFAYGINNDAGVIVGFGSFYGFLSRQNEAWKIETLSKEINQPHENTSIANDNYFLTRNGIAFAFDASTKAFYRTTQNRNLGDTNSWFQMTSADAGFLISISDQQKIITFSLVDASPLVFKGNSPQNSNFEAIQDIPISIDLGQYFVNSERIVVEGLPAKLSFSNATISGTLNNQDMFASDRVNDFVDPFRIIVGSAIAAIFEIKIQPINVNDAPVLTEILQREFLEVNQEYEGDFAELVTDPDFDPLTFRFENLPAGMTANQSYIQGSISRTGSYTIRAIVSDPNGGELTFDIPITVNASGNPGAIDGGSGGGGALGYWVFLLLFLSFVRLQTLHRYYR